tara:strand:+ start:18450 stop:19106 length:657 start_codon:yes stop_codon:yes gene_type:complete
MNYYKILFFLLFLLILGIGYQNSDTFIYLLNENLSLINSLYEKNRILFSIIFFLLYIIIATLSLPLALVMGLLAGMIFDPIIAIVLISFASSIGATFAMLISRYFIANVIQSKYESKIKIINSHLNTDGGLYLFALRMSPIFPFFIINLCFGVTNFKASKFYLISQIGMLPGTIIIILIGSELATLIQEKIIINYDLVFLLTLLGLIPLIFKKYFSKR